MLLPPLNVLRKTSNKYIVDFKGYNANPVIGEGELRDMQNLSSTYYPCISPRKPIENYVSINRQSLPGNDMIVHKGKFVYIDNGKLYYGTKYEGFTEIGTLSTTTDIKRTLVSMGDWVVVFPDKVAFHTMYPYYELRNMDYFALCSCANSDSLEFHYNAPYSFFGSTLGAAYMRLKPSSGTEVLETIKHNLKKYDYIHIVISYLHDVNGEDERVWFEGYGTVHSVIDLVGAEKVVVFENTTLTRDFNSSTFNEYGYEVDLELDCPDMDYAVSCNNRLWGIKGNNVYASALGNPFNWNKFEGVATDSYATSVDTEGDFTGAAVYNGNPVFFKENYIHRIYGDIPSNYQLITTQAYGVQYGAYKTLVNINDTLFYMNDTGVMAYQGGYPTLISDNFGAAKYKACSAGSDGRKYYICLSSYNSTTSQTEYKTLVFDTYNRLWHIYDTGKEITKFATLGGELYFMRVANDPFSDNFIYKADSGAETVQWYAILGDFDEVMNNKKGYSKLSLKVELEPSSEITVYVKHDLGDWTTVKNITSTEKKYYEIPIAPNRCNNFSIKLSGKGTCKVYSLIREFYFGGH